MYPLRVKVCEQCWLVQTEDYATANELFDAEYAYFSAYSTSWLAHAKAYVDHVVKRFDLNANSLVCEVASNDGYLLQYVNALNIPCYGVEPTASTASVAQTRGIEVVQEFFGRELASKLVAEGRSADLLIANNVLAHVPDINDFSTGFALLMKPNGVATFEFPHLLRLIDGQQFDTIYHEHFSYLSLYAVEKIFLRAGLSVFSVDELPTHGGSLRVYAQRIDTGTRPVDETVVRMRVYEASRGVNKSGLYAGFQLCADKARDSLRAFLNQAIGSGESVVGYGAAAKGNTLLNYAGISVDQVRWVADRNLAKQGKFLPGSHIPIVDEARIRAEQPNWVLILPWNLAEEVAAQLSYIREWGGQFVVAVPELTIW